APRVVSVRRARRSGGGRAERARLDRRSDELVRTMLEPLDGRQRERLMAAASELERLLRASMVEIEATDPAQRDARWCIGQYVAELGRRFDRGVDPAPSLPAAAPAP